MKEGMCIFPWTTSVTRKHEALPKDIKTIGSTAWNIPAYKGTGDQLAKLGGLPDRTWLEGPPRCKASA
jgi:D-psicose/D-tagatose/L-ribulose 3-epimerase